MKLHTYLNYGGNCRQAFEYYQEHLGGRIVTLLTHAQGPAADQEPPEWRNAVLHARLELAGTTLFGTDVPPGRFQPMRSVYLSLSLKDAEEVERVYQLLKGGAEVFMPVQETFFADRFAVLRDRFGTSWMLLHERPTATG